MPENMNIKVFQPAPMQFYVWSRRTGKKYFDVKMSKFYWEN